LGYGIGDRHDAYMILAASYRASGHDAEKTYSAIKDADRRHSAIFNRERFSKEELWNNIIATVFSPNWQGGTYGPGHPILARIRAQLPTSLLQEKEIIVDNGFIFNEFKKFSVDIEKNTIKTGIKEFDKQIKLITGTSVSILGSPGSGKTTLSMNILRNTSLNGETALFFSLDMNASLIATNMIKDITGYNIDKVFLLAKENPKEFEEIRKRALEVYKNVGYSFKFGVTPADIRDAIHEYERLHDKKVRLILIDYLENVTPPVSMDPSMASGVVAQHIANICADENVLGITLMQTQKTVKPGEPIENMRSIKGASLIEQGISVGIGIHRPGQSLKYKDYDNYMVANILKNRFGPMGSIPMFFDGEKARVRDLTSTEKLGFQDLLDMIESDKQDEKEQKKNEWKKNNSWD
jgi:replicative DNA helicase